MANRFSINPPNPLEALMMGVQGYEGASKRARQSELDAAYKDVGQQISAGGKVDQSVLGRLIGLGPTAAPIISAIEKAQSGGSSDIKEYEYAKGQGFSGSFADWVQRKRAGAGEYGLNPVWGEDDSGNPVMIQPGKSGNAIRSQLPPGVTLRGKEPIKMDTGTEFILLDPLTRQVVGRQPKDIVGKERAEEIGRGQGQATVALPGAESKAQTALDTISKLETHPGKRYAIGAAGVVPGIPGTQQRDYIALLEQAKGQTFLQAFESLKGGGAITEVEGRKAEQAIARLDRAQTPEGYDAALKDLRGVIERGLRVARQRANQPGQPQLQPPAPQPSAGGGIPPPPPGFIPVQ